MSGNGPGGFQQWRRRWYRWHGESVVLTTFWPGEYRLGQDYEVAGRRYRITRYLRATYPDARFFEVWGQAADAVELQTETASFRQPSEQRCSPLRVLRRLFVPSR